MRSRRLINELPPPPPERSFWQLLPRRNLRRALLLIIAIKRSGGLSLDKVFEQVAPADKPQPAVPGGGFQHLEVKH